MSSKSFTLVNELVSEYFTANIYLGKASFHKKEWRRFVIMWVITSNMAHISTLLHGGGGIQSITTNLKTNKQSLVTPMITIFSIVLPLNQ